jgi:hypothetical protein
LTTTLKQLFRYGKFTYDNNPNLNINDALASVEYKTLFFWYCTIKNYKQAGTPQQAYSLGIEYRDPKYWWMRTNANYLADTYVDVSPITRTTVFIRIQQVVLLFQKQQRNEQPY